MTDFFTTYDLSQIIVFLFAFMFVVKGSWDLIDYFKTKYKERFNKDYNKKVQEETLNEHYKNYIQQHTEMLEKYNAIEEKIEFLTNTVNDRMGNLETRINALTVSDMHDIKQSIVRAYHYYKDDKGWIDDFSLDTLELRYGDYQLEGGNSYIAGLMKEIRDLPKHPPLN